MCVAGGSGETVSIARTAAAAGNGAGLGPEQHEMLVSSHYNFTLLPCCARSKQPVVAAPLSTPRHVKGLSESVREGCMCWLSADVYAWSLVPQDVSSAEVSTVHASKQRYCGDDGTTDESAIRGRQRGRCQLVWVCSTSPL